MTGVHLKGFDAAGHPSAAAIKAAGLAFALFYLDGMFAPPKATVDSYLADGIAVAGLWELGAQAALGGAPQGQQDGDRTVERLRYFGAPAGAAGYGTVDFDPTPAQLGAVRGYVGAFASTLRKARFAAGVYGGTFTLENTHTLVDYTMQAAGWSGGVDFPADLRQALTQTSIGGVQVDSDDALTARFGAWNAAGLWPPLAPVPSHSPLELARAQLGRTDPADYWALIWPKHPSDAVNWCAVFVSFCFAGGGKALPKMHETAVTSGFAYCPDAETWAKANGWWTETPQQGDVVLFCWDGSGTPQHTGIVESVNADGSLDTIEGNAANAEGVVGVWRHIRARSEAVGFLRPFPAPTPHPISTPEVPMFLVHDTTKNAWWLVSGERKESMTPAQLPALIAEGIPQRKAPGDFTVAELDALEVVPEGTF